MTKHWHSREYKEGDEKEILGLYKLVFGTEISDEYWLWKYKRNAAGPALIVVAEAEQGIVGQYALLPRLLKIGDKVCSAGLSVDTMVHPDYQGQGIFVTLAKETYNLAARKEIRFIYGFPNGNSYHGFITKLGWTDLYKGIPLWVKPLNIENILKKRLINNKLLASLGDKVGDIAIRMLYRTQRKSISGCSIREIYSFDPRFEFFWDKVLRNHKKIMMVRDRAFLTWRYVEKPANDYVILIAEKKEDLLGYIVLRCMEEFGLQISFIVDILTIDDKAGVSVDLIFAAIDYFRQKEMDIVGSLMLPGNRYSHSLKQTGFIKAPGKLLPQNMYLGIRSFTPSQTADFLAKPNNWFITWGDHDVI